MRFAICDDEAYWVKRISAFVNKHYKQLQITCICDEFTSPQLLINACKTTSYDAIFLDVSMSQNGIKVAGEISKISSRTMFIFISSYIEFAKDCFPVKAKGYVLKQEIESFLPERLDALLQELCPPENTIELNINGGKDKINLTDIQYFEANEHFAVLVKAEENGQKQKASISLSKLEQKLINKPFFRIHKSYIANMKHIKSIKNYKATFKSGIVLPVSEARFSKARDNFLIWKSADL